MCSEVEQLVASGEDADLPPISLDLRGNCLPERFNARLASADIFPVTEALRNDVRVFYLVLRGLDTIEDGMALGGGAKRPAAAVPRLRLQQRGSPPGLRGRRGTRARSIPVAVASRHKYQVLHYFTKIIELGSYVHRSWMENSRHRNPSL